MVRWRQRWERYADFWDEREHPRVLALARILVGCCWLYDFLTIWRLDLVVPLFGGHEVGGWSNVARRSSPPWFYEWFPFTVDSATLLHGTITVAAFFFVIGLFTRSSLLVMVLFWAQLEAILPNADRGVDTLSRCVMLILLFSQCGGTWSVDSWLKTRTFTGHTFKVPAWPRKLLIAQLVLMYTMAGVLKLGITWWPMGSYAALYYALQDPAVAAYDFGFLRNQPFFFVTQVSTAVTMIYQWTYPTVLVLMYWRRTPEKGGRMRKWANQYRLEWIWIGIGAVFHIVLAATMNLGIFPYVMLALYPVWLHPDELGRLLGRMRRAMTPIVGSNRQGIEVETSAHEA